jgi:hypothetical protein
MEEIEFFVAHLSFPVLKRAWFLDDFVSIALAKALVVIK